MTTREQALRTLQRWLADGVLDAADVATAMTGKRALNRAANVRRLALVLLRTGKDRSKKLTRMQAMPSGSEHTLHDHFKNRSLVAHARRLADDMRDNLALEAAPSEPRPSAKDDFKSQ